MIEGGISIGGPVMGPHQEVERQGLGKEGSETARWRRFAPPPSAAGAFL